MTALLVFEALHGGTRAAARAVADGLLESVPVQVVEIDARTVDAPPRSVPDEVDLLVLGVPSQVLDRYRSAGPSRVGPGARRATLLPSADLRQWLRVVRLPAHDLVVAAFDTVPRLDVPGAAARAMQRVLERHGGVRPLPVRSFATIGANDQLAEGQLTSARDWGRALGVLLAVVVR